MVPMRLITPAANKRRSGGVVLPQPEWPGGRMFLISGCVAIGVLFALFTGPVLVREEVRVALFIGVLGGYTTFSSFGRETIALVHDGQWLFAALNVLLSNVLGLLGVFAGDRLVTRLFG